ncbi:unnamed protein product [Urochloa humidicola]
MVIAHGKGPAWASRARSLPCAPAHGTRQRHGPAGPCCLLAIGGVPAMVLLDAFRPPLAIGGGAERKWEWNDLFWAVHPGSRGILDHIDAALRLDPGKLAASRVVVTDYGNMLSATVIFVLEELRRRMDEEGDEAEWGMMVGFGPGFTVETMVLHATKK